LYIIVIFLVFIRPVVKISGTKKAPRSAASYQPVCDPGALNAGCKFHPDHRLFLLYTGGKDGNDMV